jgi:hypothetical protein
MAVTLQWFVRDVTESDRQQLSRVEMGRILGLGTGYVH